MSVLTFDFSVIVHSWNGNANPADDGAFQVRDKRRKGWFITDNDFVDRYGKVFGAIGSVVYFSLCRHADAKRECFPSEKFIAEEFAVSDRSVRTYLKQLKQGKLIHIARKSRKNGKWQRNVYTLLDKSEWKSPEDIISAGIQRKIKTPPEENRDIDQRKMFPTNNTNEKNTHRNNTHNAKQSFALVDEMIEKFAPINPSYRRLLINVTQRKTTERLIKELGVEKLSQVLEILPYALPMKYCPVVTKPTELEYKLPKLFAFLSKEEASIQNRRNLEKYRNLRVTVV